MIRKPPCAACAEIVRVGADFAAPAGEHTCRNVPRYAIIGGVPGHEWFTHDSLLGTLQLVACECGYRGSRDGLVAHVKLEAMLAPIDDHLHR